MKKTWNWNMPSWLSLIFFSKTHFFSTLKPSYDGPVTGLSADHRHWTDFKDGPATGCVGLAADNMGYHPVTGPSWYRYGGGRRSSDRLKSSSWADSLSRFKDEHGHIAPVLRPSSISIAARVWDRPLDIKSMSNTVTRRSWDWWVLLGIIFRLLQG